jgi:hypothetical protein
MAESGMTAFGMKPWKAAVGLASFRPIYSGPSGSLSSGRHVPFADIDVGWGEFPEYRYERLNRARARKDGDLSLG